MFLETTCSSIALAAVAGLLPFTLTGTASGSGEGSSPASGDHDPIVATAGTVPPATPDRVAEFAGGAAARLHVDGTRPTPGEVYLLMATAGSDDAARVYDHTPYRHARGPHDDTRESNLSAAAFVAGVSGADVQLLELTSAPAGGDSGGVAYALGYLDIASEGGFSAGLAVAATGRIRDDGYLSPIKAVDEKTAAAAFAGVDVLFTTSVPREDTIATHGARFVGELEWTPAPDTTLGEQRRWDRYHDWGAARRDGLDVVAVRHFGDVAAYLCGAGSAAACEAVEVLDVVAGA